MTVEPFKGVKGPRSPNYRKGFKYRSRCETTYLTDLLLCGSQLTTKPREDLER